MMTCEEIMKRKVLTVNADDTIQKAAERMASANVGFLPVMDGSGRVRGTITDRDIAIRAVAKNRSPDCAVSEVMSEELVSCRPEDDLATAEELMARRKKSRILVMDAGGTLVGVISLSDVVARDSGRRAAVTLKHVAGRESQ
jgi:CBS domain-containing protein